MTEQEREKWQTIFRSTWGKMSRHGFCDCLDGAEYTRCYALWVERNRPLTVSAFILQEANRPPKR